MKKLVFLASLFFLSCSTGPDSVTASTWSLKHEMQGTIAKNYLIGECKIYNSSSDTVYKDYTAEMTITGKNVKTLQLNIPVKIDTLMPYNYGSFSVRLELNDFDLNKIISETSSDREKLTKEGVLEDIFFSRENITLKKIKFVKTDINNLLKGK